MSDFKYFAIAGAGAIGSFIAEELLKIRCRGNISEVRVLTRSEPWKHYDLASKGATIVTVDYSSPYSLQSALHEIDVLISTVGTEALHLQENLAKAAKAAQVQLFVPSEFGSATAGRKMEDIPPLARGKETFRRRLYEIGLPFAVFYTGLFPDYVFTEPWFAKGLGFDFADRKFVLSGKGRGIVSFTGRRDVARYVAFVLTTMPRNNLLWKIFRIEGERTSFKALLDQYQQRIGAPIDVRYRPISDLEDALAADPGCPLISVSLYAERGGLIVGGVDERDNDLFRDWNPSKAIDLITSNLE